MRLTVVSIAIVSLLLVGIWMPQRSGGEEEGAKPKAAAKDSGNDAKNDTKDVKPAKRTKIVKPQPIPPFVEKAIGWLVEAQQENGGWGGGSHARQDIRDPHKVKTDPATTAFAAMALMRVGNTPTSGSHQDSVRRALLYLVETVEEAPAKGPKITDITGTQPQTKLGQIVDTSMTAQFLARALKSVPEESDLHARVDKALTKCVDKLQKAQGEKGGWNLAGGGWAPVLQSSWACNALELASAVGNKAVQPKALEKARDNQKMAVDTKTGKASAKDAAGVELYAFAGGQRAAAGENRAAEEIVRRAKEEGKLAEDAEVDEDSLRQAGVDAPKAAKLAQANAQFKAQVDRLDDKQLLKGFGNNGGEEFMSFLLTGESLVIAGGDRWNKWYDKMVGLTKEAQNPDGSWSGHHCITSPVFSTAAVVQVLTVDRDAELLIAIAEQSEQDAKKTAKK